MLEYPNELSNLLKNLSVEKFKNLLAKIQKKIQEENFLNPSYNAKGKKRRKNEGWDYILEGMELNRDDMYRLLNQTTMSVDDKILLFKTIEAILLQRGLEINEINGALVVEKKSMANIESSILSNDALADKNKIYFKVYYWSNSTAAKEVVDVGLMTINENYAELNIYNYPDASKVLGKMLSPNEKPNVIVRGSNVFIELQDNDNQSIKSFIIGYIQHGNSLKDCKFIEGAFSTVGRSSAIFHPLAGLLLMERIEGKTTDISQTIRSARDNISPALFNLLYRTRLEVKQPVNNLEDLSESEEISRVKPYAGMYNGYILNTTFTQKYLMAFVLCIQPNTESFMYVKLPTNGNKIYKGRVRVTRELNSELVGYFDFKEESRIYRFTLYIHKEMQNSKYLYGIYAGVENEKDSVIAGRIRLERYTEIINIPEFENKTYIRNYEIKDNQLPVDLVGDIDLKSFLFNVKIHPHDYLDIILSNGLKKKIEENSFKFAGTYRVAGLSTKQDRILICPIIINEDASIEMKVKDGETLYGEAFFDNNCRLGLSFNKYEEKEWIAYYIFNVSAHEHDETKYFSGSSCRLNTQNNPTGRVEVLIRESFDYENSNFIGVKIEDKSTVYTDLMKWLIGKYNRTVVAPKNIADFKSRDRDEEYVNIHFYSACYLAKKQPKQALENLYKAYLHGFKGINILEKELKKGGKLKVLFDDKKTKSKPKNTTLEELNCEEICKHIIDKWG